MPGAKPRDVVAAAAAIGMHFTAVYVKRVRYLTRKAAKQKRRPRRRASPPSIAELRREERAEAALRRTIAEVGLARAREVLAEVERRFGS